MHVCTHRHKRFYLEQLLIWLACTWPILSCVFVYLCTLVEWNVFTAYHRTTPPLPTRPKPISPTSSRQEQMKAKREAMRRKKDAGNPKLGETYAILTRCLWSWPELEAYFHCSLACKGSE